MSISKSLQRIVIASIFLISSSCLSAQTMVPWLTHSMDNSRTGWNPHETLLTQASVGTKGIVRSTIIPLVGDARGMEAQPLILPQVTTPLGVRDVLVLPSMANVIRGVDAHDGSGIWQTSLGTPITGTRAIDGWQINQFWGCLSTGVIDPDLKRLYQVCWIVPNAQGTPLPAAPASTDAKVARYFMFVLNVGDGTLVTDPVMIQGTSNGADFNAFPRKQRSALVETGVNGLKTVFGCSGTINETDPGAAGYCFAFDVATNKQTALFATTSGAGAGIWMAGQGAAADPDGNLYVITGNGDFDGSAQWAESFLKLHYIPPPSAQGQGGIRVVDHWTPWTDLTRSGGQPAPQGKLAGVSAPSEPMMAMNRPVGAAMDMSFKGAVAKSAVDAKGNLVVRVYPKIPTGDWSDEDWGSAGPACIFSLGICIASGKDGIAYPIKTASMGGTTLKDLKNPPANCAKLAGPPVWLTMDPGPVDPCPKDPRTLNFFPWGVTAHMHMTPVQFFDPVLQSWTIFAWGENYQLHKWKVSPNGQLTYLAQGNQLASIETPHTATHHGGMTGGFCSGSSNGSDPNSAILVCTIPYNDANQDKTNGRLLVYDPVHLAADGSLKLLWDSQAQGIPFLFNKFNPPIIDGGQIYVPNYNGGVDLYRLTP